MTAWIGSTPLTTLNWTAEENGCVDRCGLIRVIVYAVNNEEQNVYLYVFVTNDYIISTENQSVREEGFQLIRSFLNKMYVVVSKLPV